MKEKPTLEFIDSKLKTYGDTISMIDNKIKELRAVRSKYYDKYSLYRYFRIRHYRTDILSIGLSVSGYSVDESKSLDDEDNDTDVVYEDETTGEHENEESELDDEPYEAENDELEY